MADSFPPIRTVLRRISIAEGVLNVVGALLAYLYLSVIDPMPSGQAPVHALEGAGIVFFVAILVVTFIIGTTVTRKRDGRVAKWYERLREGASAEEVPDNVRRDALNVAPRAAVVSTAMWLMASVSSGGLSGSIRAFVGVGVSGLLATTMSYFVVDLLWRPSIPLFFPRGDLSTAGAFRLPVLGRLLIVFALIGILPPALLVNLTWRRAQVLLTAPNPQTVLTNLFILQVFILASSIVASIGLAISMSRGITNPLDALQRVMRRIKEHDLDVRVAMTTNDELGYLAERFNEMAVGLKEREQIQVSHQRMEQELAVAWQIQESFLPRALPHVPGWQLTATLEPAKQTSGDFYDLIPLSDGQIGILVADVAGKGMGAALYMALSRTLIRTYAVECGAQPERALETANRRILADAQADLFVTVFYGVLDPGSGLLTYSNAGHNPPYLVRRDGPVGSASDDGVLALMRTGMPLGIFEDGAWEQQRIQLDPGDVLVLYSDGITEAHNAEAELFGKDRLLDVARAGAGRTAQDIQDTLIAEVRAFRGEAPQFDDITLLVLVRDPAAAGSTETTKGGGHR